MQEQFKKYWNQRLEEFPELDDADKLEAFAAFEAAWNNKLLLKPFEEKLPFIKKDK